MPTTWMPGRVLRLREVHGAELAGADQADPERPALGGALRQHAMKVHRHSRVASAQRQREPERHEQHRHHVADQHDRRDLARLLPVLLGDHEVEHRGRQAAEEEEQALLRRGRGRGSAPAARRARCPVSGQTSPPTTPRCHSSQRASASRTPSESSISGIDASPDHLDRERQPFRASADGRAAKAKPRNVATTIGLRNTGQKAAWRLTMCTPSVKCDEVRDREQRDHRREPGRAEAEVRERQPHVAAVVEHHRRHPGPVVLVQEPRERPREQPRSQDHADGCRRSAARWRRGRSPCSRAPRR